LPNQDETFGLAVMPVDCSSQFSKQLEAWFEKLV